MASELAFEELGLLLPPVVASAASIAVMAILLGAVAWTWDALRRARAAAVVRYANLFTAMVLLLFVPAVVIAAQFSASSPWTVAAVPNVADDDRRVESRANGVVADQARLSTIETYAAETPLIPTRIDATSPRREALTLEVTRAVMRGAGWLVLLWGVVSFYLAARLMVACIKVSRLGTRLQLVDEPEWNALIDDLCRTIGIRRRPQLYRHPGRHFPFTYGIVRPRIVVSDDHLREFDRVALRAVIGHELGHLRRRDHWAGLGQRFVALVYWWNPLISRLSGELDRLREEICDNVTLQLGIESQRLARLLLDLAAEDAGRSHPLAAQFLGAPSGGLAARVRQLIKGENDMSTQLQFADRLRVTLFAAVVGSAIAVAPSVRLQAQDAESNTKNIGTAADSVSADEASSAQVDKSKDKDPSASQRVPVWVFPDGDGGLGAIWLDDQFLGKGATAIRAFNEKLGRLAAKDRAAKGKSIAVLLRVETSVPHADVVKLLDVATQHVRSITFAAVDKKAKLHVRIGFVRDESGKKLQDASVVFFGDDIVRPREIGRRLERERQLCKDDAVLMIHASPDVSAGTVQNLIKQAQRVGFQRLTLNTDRPKAEKPDPADSPDVEAAVLNQSQNGTMVEISVGADDGVRPGQRWTVVGQRDGKPHATATLEIVRVEVDRAVGRVVSRLRDATIRKGARVIGQSDRLQGRVGIQSVKELTGNAGAVLPSNGVRQDLDVQLHCQGPAKSKLEIRKDGKWSGAYVLPARLTVNSGRYQMRLSDLPDRPGLVLFPTIDVVAGDPQLQAFLQHSAVPWRLTEEDVDQAVAGNLVVKAIYLPDAKHQELAIAGVESVVSTRVDPGVDPIKAAASRGSLIAVIRLGNRQLDSE